MAYIFNEAELLATAKAVQKFNESQKATLPHVLVERMKIIAMANFKFGDPATYLSTMGFVLTAFYIAGDNENIHIKASVAASLFSKLPDIE